MQISEVENIIEAMKMIGWENQCRFTLPANWWKGIAGNLESISKARNLADSVLEHMNPGNGGLLQKVMTDFGLLYTI